MKTIKVENGTHMRLQRLTKKNEPFAHSVKRLLSESPFINAMRLAYDNYTVTTEKAKNFQSDNPTELGKVNAEARHSLEDLVREVKAFIELGEKR